MTVAFDTNILIYAGFEPDTAKGTLAARLVGAQVPKGAVIPVQVLGEFLRFAQRRGPAMLQEARRQLPDWRLLAVSPPTTLETVEAAIQVSRDHGLQFWDALIVSASASAGATTLISEDMQDGRLLGGLRILDPFNPANAAQVARLTHA